MLKERITPIQATLLIVNIITPTAILHVPSTTVRAAGQDAWMTILLAWACSIGVVGLYVLINRQNPGLPFLTFLERRFGKVIGIIVGLLLAQYYLATFSTIIRELMNFLSDKVLSRTPLLLTGGVAVFVGMYAVAHGLEVIARAGIVMFIVGSLILIGSDALGVGQMHWKHLAPFAAAPAGHVLFGSLPPLGWLSESSVLLLLGPYLSKPNKAWHVGFWGVTIAAAALLNGVVVVVLVFGAELPNILLYPSASVTEMIDYDFIERVDMLFSLAWVGTVYLKICVYTFAMMHCFQSIFKVRNKKPFFVSMGLLVLLTALYSWRSNVYLVEHERVACPPFLITFNIVLPLLLLLGLLVTKRKSQPILRGAS